MEGNLTPLDLNDRVLDTHRHLRGTDRRKAVKRFLDMACRIQLYGVDIHNVLVEGQDWVIGVDSRGILTFSRNQFERFTEGKRIKWSEIKEFRYRENRFTLIRKNAESPMTYNLESTARARRLYLSMMENHKFHRPDSGSKTTRSRITDIIGRFRSPQTVSPPPAERRERGESDVQEGKGERRSSAPPKVVHDVTQTDGV